VSLLAGIKAMPYALLLFLLVSAGIILFTAKKNIGLRCSLIAERMRPNKKDNRKIFIVRGE